MAKIPPHLLRRRSADPTAKPVSKIGPTEGLTDRNVATPPPVEAKTGAGDVRTKIFTYFTGPPAKGEATPILYNGDRLWARVTVTLQTAGPVAVGDVSQLSPVLSGRGALLVTNVPYTFTIARGTKLYIASPGVNRVLVEIAPVPWLEQITGTLMGIFERMKALATGK
jgi:hypothetical protein